ncbi:MAG: protease inhibitor I42 family protein [Hyphomicrobium sp.]|uniref:hypothetical protein n=1 Tax=Hyphomicrobium sp. TaxID=82 RepID=UPI003D0A25C6
MEPAYRRSMMALMVLAGLLMANRAWADTPQATPLQITVGDVRTLSLEGNPQGYVWVLRDERGTDGKVVSVEVRGYVPGATRSTAEPGREEPAEYRILLAGVAPGRVTLTFDYVQAGTKAALSSRAYAVEVLDEAARAPPADGAPLLEGEDPTSDIPAESSKDLFADPNETEDGGGEGK